jgi:Lrp/AsnC family transcriptional regulator, leucine-responsive regulatory protein
MAYFELDDVDRGVLHYLQEDARNMTAAEMADHLDVSSSTIRNRIEILEQEGIIRGYHPDINYEQAQFQHHVVVVCRAPVSERSELVEEVMTIEGVVTVREMLTGESNVHVEAVGADSEEIDRITSGLTALGLEIESIDLVKDLHVQPFDQFGSDRVDG